LDQRPLPEMQSLDAGPIGGEVIADEFIAHLAPVDLHRLALIFDWLGDHAEDLRTGDGQHLNDATDWAAFLHEVAAAARKNVSA